ncbi:hypothetical protein DID74_01640 [Candidatus Marinamargulisbacteria bacterium SCGC AG-333-B06]|nr:hypothetical protein DID74_01640 [Candidatus Marinamargulisbacteria bacterium SCGC AG-333-B06]
MSVDALILCGGLGTRLQGTVPDLPKVLAPVQGKPFLEWLIQFYQHQGITRFILCTGYRSEQIKIHSQQSVYQDIDICISDESIQLGTGGALWKAKSYIQSSPFLVLNGDTFCDVSIVKSLNIMKEKEPVMLMAMLNQDNASRYGSIIVDEDNKIQSFEEKSAIKKSGFINAGSYMISQTIFEHYIPSKACFSLEYDVFSYLSKHKLGMYGMIVDKESFIDMGTKDSYEKANSSFLFPSF